MNSTIFIPKIIRVGSQKRSDTYTNRLSYIIYYDSKNKLRKETSWESWRDKKIDPENFDNLPTEGFVLNKKVGDYSSDWNHRSAYCRVYDPRGFEFEITIENLLYILQNTNSIKGKGLEGNFVYGWNGKDLLLIPTEAPEYIEFSKYSDMLNKPQSIKGKDLILGARYKTNLNKVWTYLGRFKYYNEDSKDLGLHYWFYNESTNNKYEKINRLTLLSGKVVQLENAESSNNYANLISEIECYSSFSPVDYQSSEYEECSTQYFNGNYQNYSWNKPICFEYNGLMQKAKISRNYDYYTSRYSRRESFTFYDPISPEKILNEQYNLMDLMVKYNFKVCSKQILQNGKPLQKEN